MIKREVTIPDIGIQLKGPINKKDLGWLLTAEQKTTVFYSVI
jgi:hypothetical protein